MNKKFTFMVAALLAAGSSFAATVDLGNKPEAAGSASNGKYYYVVYDDDATLDASKSYALGATSSGLKGIQYASTKFTTGDGETDANYLWKVTSKLDEDGKTWLYSFFNVATEKYLSASTDGSNPALKKESELTASDNIWFNWQTTENTTGVYTAGKLPLLLGGTNELKVEASISVGSDAENIYLFEVKESVIKDAADLNATMAGDGFSFDLADGTEVEDANNIFSKPMKAFYVSGISATGGNVPEGMYFATEYPESLEGVDKNTISDILEFQKCKFVAVSPQLISGSDYASTGLKLVEVFGTDLARYEQNTADKDVTKGEEVWVNNACFTVTEKDNVNKPGQYTLSLANIRYQSKTDGTHANATNVFIGLNSNKVVTTVAEASAKEFKCVNSTVVDGLKLVADSKTPSIFNIQFVSGEGKDSENGKYLGVGVVDSNLDFVAQGESLVDLESAQYRFVISDVQDEVITFKNLETGTELKASLYETAEGYRLKTSSQVRIAKSGDVSDANYAAAEDLDNMEIKLTKVEANTEAGFLVKAPNNNEPFKFAFATKENATEKLYLAEGESDATLLSDKAAEGLQFVFEPVAGEDGLITITSDYVYTEGGKKRYGDKATMTTIQKYVLRVVEAGNARYAKVAINAIKLDGTSENATPFVAKVNYDGSVSLVDASSPITFDKDLKRFAVNTSKNAIDNNTSGKSIYWVPDADKVNSNEATLSMYLVAENLGLSLEAVSKHISLEAENGGFVKVAENGDGIVDNLATEGTEDLTFWLDTTNSKSVLPAFYISKAGKFMYNSTDSATVWKEEDGANPYKVGEYNKAIFKAATLVDSETLKTTVDNKEVTVAAEANQNKGIVAGIGNFQFNIVKADDAEDNYILRSVQGTNYVTSNNNVLVFTNDKDAAMRVIVSTEEAPTSNEGVAASEVKVVAQNGSVVVKNAAGKNVVVSTILGQEVANEVLTSDNATINVPAGIVVVAVEGESFKVNVK